MRFRDVRQREVQTVRGLFRRLAWNHRLGDQGSDPATRIGS